MPRTERSAEPLTEAELRADSAGSFDVLVEHCRERHQRGEPLHPAWLPAEDSPFRVSESLP